MKTLLLTLDQKLRPLRDISDKAFAPILLLIIRLYMANIFFSSGWGKLQDTINGNFSNVLDLFTYIHPIPLLPPMIAAILGVGGEILFSALLALGIFTRLGALGLFFMTILIQFAVPAEYEIANPDHYFWMLLLLVPFIYGGGKLSGDHFMIKYIRGE